VKLPSIAIAVAMAVAVIMADASLASASDRTAWSSPTRTMASTSLPACGPTRWRWLTR
jgi:hypothetical protein